MHHGTCAHCAAAFTARRPDARYCSNACRERAKYARAKASGLEARKRARRNARYVRHPLVRVPRYCTAGDCRRKHVALGLCSKHYKQRRRELGLTSVKPTITLLGMASLHGAYFPKLKAVKAKVTVGVMVRCPACGPWMGGIRPDRRFCHHCGTTLVLNPEELDLLIAAERERRAA